MKPALCGAEQNIKNEYRLHYCGTCKVMGTFYSQKSRLALNNDIVFLSEILSYLSNEIKDFTLWNKNLHAKNCFKLPYKKENIPNSLKFASTLNIILAKLKIKDNVEDTKNSKKYLWKILDFSFENEFKKAKKQLKSWNINIDEIIQQIAIQKEREEKEVFFDTSKEYLDFYSEPTSIITALSFKNSIKVIEKEHYADTMYLLGYNFGKLIYLLDAFEDVEKDYKKNNFNAINKAFKLKGEIPLDIKEELAIIFKNLKKEIIYYINELDINKDKKFYFTNILTNNLSKKLNWCYDSTLSKTCGIKSKNNFSIDLSKPNDKKNSNNNSNNSNKKSCLPNCFISRRNGRFCDCCCDSCDCCEALSSCDTCACDTCPCDGCACDGCACDC